MKRRDFLKGLAVGAAAITLPVDFVLGEVEKPKNLAAMAWSDTVVDEMRQNSFFTGAPYNYKGIYIYQMEGVHVDQDGHIQGGRLGEIQPGDASAEV